MLSIRSVGDLASRLRIMPRRLYQIADRVDEYVRLYELLDPARPDRKPRIVISPTGPLRRVQVILLRHVFRQRMHPTPFSFGGIPGRNAVQNANRHLESRFVYTTDICNFFPSLAKWRLLDIFEDRLGCSGDVSQLLTRLCTYDGHLAQGLITSPVLADYAVRRVDLRIAGLCHQRALTYSRFVDDITVSGRFPLPLCGSGVVELIRRILRECGFEIAVHKEQAGALADGTIAITGLRLLRGHWDVKTEYLHRLQEHLGQHQRLARDQEFSGPLFTRDQLAGRIDYVCSINPHRRKELRQKLSLINWDAVMRHAAARGLLVCRKSLRPVPTAADDDCRVEVCSA